jgi:diadenosine tetraphosphate (Ap4A) HIT family hydrolase
MPHLITRAEALARIRAEGGDPPCLMCAIRDGRVGPRYTIAEDDEALVLLPRYVRRWGHVLVMPRVHVTTYTAVDRGLWARVGALAHRAACVVERVMAPRRCYVASTGSSAGELTQSSAHLHVHVIPLYSPEDRPADVFSWADGIYVGEPDEWASLRARYLEAWAE